MPQPRVPAPFLALALTLVAGLLTKPGGTNLEENKRLFPLKFVDCGFLVDVKTATVITVAVHSVEKLF